MYFGLQSMYYKYSWGVNFWDEPAQSSGAAHLDLISCKGDSAAMQAVVSADEDFVLTTGDDPVFWKGGPLLIARVAMHWHDASGCIVPQLKVIGLMPDDDGRSKSDVLLDVKQIYVEKRKQQQLWLEFNVPKEARAGLYSGQLQLYTHTMFEDEQVAAELTFTLKVLDRQLPPPDKYRFYLDLWQHNSNIARKYDVELWSEEHFALLDGYLESLAALGQKSASVVVSEIPWSGQSSHIDSNPSDLFEYSAIKVRKRRDGVLVYDYSALDRYIEMAQRYGIKEEIELFGLLNVWQTKDRVYRAIVDGHPDGIRIRYYDERLGCYRFVRERAELQAYIEALAAHLIVKGWIDKVRIMADEPDDLEKFNERLKALRDLVPSFKLKVAINHAQFIAEKIEGVHDYVPKLDCALRDWRQIRALLPDIPGRMLYYVCNNPLRPNTFLGSPAIESRIIPWLAEKLGLEGFLRWNYTVWPDQPLQSIQYRPAYWPAGDTNFVYPGKTGKPLLSLRYKWLQRGIRDFELMQQLKEEGYAAEVMRLLDSVFYFDDERLAEGTLSLHQDAEQLYSLDGTAYDELFTLLESTE